MLKSVNVQYCPCGHVEVSFDPEHIQMAEERERKGTIDALTLPDRECPQCREEDTRQLRMLHEMVGPL